MILGLSEVMAKLSPVRITTRAATTSIQPAISRIQKIIVRSRQSSFDSKRQVEFFRALFF